MVSLLTSRSTSKLTASLANLTCITLALSGSIGFAQSACSSDGVPPPRVLQERFISADCETCWSEHPVNATRPRSVALDWLVPSTQDNDAPLSAVASRDALVRLDALSSPKLANDKALQRDSRSLLKSGALRVAMGPAVGGYVGASIRWQPVSKTGQWTAWLALVETVPAGQDSTPVERNLVRNLLVLPFLSPLNEPDKLSKKEHLKFIESRSMSLPAGAQPERLRVVGWVENSQGHTVAIAQSICATAAKPH